MVKVSRSGRINWVMDLFEGSVYLLGSQMSTICWDKYSEEKFQDIESVLFINILNACFVTVRLVWVFMINIRKWECIALPTPTLIFFQPVIIS